MTSSDQTHTGPHTSDDVAQEKWQTVRSVGGQRLQRIGQILQSASKEMLTELKDGTTELEGASREALETWLAEQPEAEAKSPQHDESSVRGWKSIFGDLGAIAQNRKSVWLHRLAQQLSKDLSRFDADMHHRYGDRYERFRQPISWLKNQLHRYGDARPEEAEPTTTSVEVEVMEERPSE